MCKCTPGTQTPFCSRPGCEWPPSKPKLSATPAEAEALSKTLVVDYLAACNASTDPVAVGNFLMKLVSVTSVMMAATEGSYTTAERLLGTAQFVLTTMPKKLPMLRPVL